MNKSQVGFFYIFMLLISVLQAQSNYSFFVAGHSYGQPAINSKGLHPPLKNKFSYLQNRFEIEFGVLTGDIVEHASVASWDSVDADINALGLPVYFAPGNHDMTNRPLYESRYGASYYHFLHHNDLFIILDPNIDGWNISGAQFTYLDSLLNSTSLSVDNIFVFFHQVLWHEHYPSIIPNSMAGRADSINFWTEVEPLFSILPNQVFMFSGDFYAWTYATEVMYDRYDNISLIGSGMGGGAKDNFIFVNVGSNKQVCYDLICLESSNLDCLGPLSNHQVFTNSAEQKHELESVIIFPNPCSKALQLKLDQPIYKTKIRIFDSKGSCIKEIYYEQFFKDKISLDSIDNGIYYLQVVQHSSSKTIKFIKWPTP
jgi:hypothetical protein